MAEIYVQSSAALQGVIDELNELCVEFNNKKEAIQNEQEALVSKWQGDASTAFNENWMKESQNFRTLYDVAVKYVGALREILAKYETAEEQAKQIASN